jgi:hypothetical protein
MEISLAENLVASMAEQKETSRGARTAEYWVYKWAESTADEWESQRAGQLEGSRAD